MKKISCFLLTGLVVACLVACGSDPSSTLDASNPPVVERNAPEVTYDTQRSGSGSSDSNSNEPSFDPDMDIFSMEEETSNEESEKESIMQQNTFYVSVSGEIFSATFAGNSGAQALRELLAGGDITIQMSDYGGFEKVGSLGHSLPTSDSHTTTQSGDIVLYQGDQIVIFYGSNSWSYTQLGKIDDLTGWEEALGNSAVSVTLSLQG